MKVQYQSPTSGSPNEARVNIRYKSQQVRVGWQSLFIRYIVFVSLYHIVMIVKRNSLPWFDNIIFLAHNEMKIAHNRLSSVMKINYAKVMN